MRTRHASRTMSIRLAKSSTSSLAIPVRRSMSNKLIGSIVSLALSSCLSSLLSVFLCRLLMENGGVPEWSEATSGVASRLRPFMLINARLVTCHTIKMTRHYYIVTCQFFRSTSTNKRNALASTRPTEGMDTEDSVADAAASALSVLSFEASAAADAPNVEYHEGVACEASEDEIALIREELGYVPSNLVRVRATVATTDSDSDGDGDGEEQREEKERRRHPAVLQLYPLRNREGAHKKRQRAVVEPFPTIYWLASRELKAKVSVLEDQRYVQILEDRMLASESAVKVRHWAARAELLLLAAVLMTTVVAVVTADGGVPCGVRARALGDADAARPRAGGSPQVGPRAARRGRRRHPELCVCQVPAHALRALPGHARQPDRRVGARAAGRHRRRRQGGDADEQLDVLGRRRVSRVHKQQQRVVVYSHASVKNELAIHLFHSSSLPAPSIIN